MVSPEIFPTQVRNTFIVIGLRECREEARTLVSAAGRILDAGVPS